SVHILAPETFEGIVNTNELVQALLPELDPEHARLVVVPAGAEVSARLAVLSAICLGDALIAAKHDVRKNRSSGLTLMRRIASSFGDDHVGALKFVFATHASMSEDFTPFDPQIAVLNLNELRHEGTAERIVGLLADIDISYADALQIA